MISGSSYKFDSPYALAADGGDLFVTLIGDSVTELSASSGALVRVISGSRYNFDFPEAIAADGGELFVVNLGGDSVTSFAAS